MEKTHVTLFDGLRTTIQTRHHTYHADEPEDAGGTDTAVSPVEMVMGALGSCIAMTLRMYAERKNWDLRGVEVTLDFERFSGKDYPDYEGDSLFVHEIRKRIVVHGDLDESQRERLLEIASKCPVHRLIDTPSFWVNEILSAEDAEAAEAAEGTRTTAAE